ncbi:MAG TPA: hypothetical protein VK892_16655 [Pyrinomonadaceae bacterium]|nr:hypothetical protein [Pyrinomonadaceae bacterium]
MKRKIKHYIIGWFAYTPMLNQEGEFSINLTDGYSLISSTSKKLAIESVKQKIFSQPKIHQHSKIGIFAKELKVKDLKRMIDKCDVEFTFEDALKRKKREVWADTIEV